MAASRTKNTAVVGGRGGAGSGSIFEHLPTSIEHTHEGENDQVRIPSHRKLMSVPLSCPQDEALPLLCVCVWTMLARVIGAFLSIFNCRISSVCRQIDDKSKVFA